MYKQKLVEKLQDKMIRAEIAKSSKERIRDIYNTSYTVGGTNSAINKNSRTNKEGMNVSALFWQWVILISWFI
jgi:hypothetical protein